MVDDDRLKLHPVRKIEYKNVRFRTLGCYPLTGGIESNATTLDEIIDETLSAVESERSPVSLTTRQPAAWNEERGRVISKMSGLLKFITCGSVDDGKSTLIGHIFIRFQTAFLRRSGESVGAGFQSRKPRGKSIIPSLLDGLMAEREQGITIDVAYRYFWHNRKEKLYRQILRDMRSTQETWQSVHPLQTLPLSLWDAKQGVLVQTRRHARICALMGIRYFVFAVNKMDLVDYSEERFKEIVDQIQELSNCI